MTAASFEDILATNGGNIQYLFHVSGYNWAVATSQALVDNLNNPLHVASRRAIFGIEEDTGDYWADDTSLCPIFPLLDVPGAQEFQLHEGNGEISGGSWSVSIRDKQLGHTWEHGGATIFRGLPGLHHTLGPDYDSTVGWAYITSNLEVGDDSFTVEEQSAGNLLTGIDAASSFPHRLLWIGQECIAADAISGSGTAYTIEISKDGSDNLGRGLFRSKHQNHYKEYYSQFDPIVSDTPFSIIDKPCWLWAVALSDDNTDILAGPVCLRSGVVSNNIETRDGVTSISVLTPFRQLDTEVRAPVFKEHLAKYIFARQKDANASLAFKKQAAHLYIWEFDSNGDRTTTKPHEIWLCARSAAATTTVTYDTTEEVLDALGSELALCTRGSSSQVSGDATIGYVDLIYEYTIQGGQIWQSQHDTAGTEVYYRSLISGPLAWLLNLGPVFNRLDWVVGNRQGLDSNSPWFFSRKSFYGGETRTSLKYPWMVCNVTNETIANASFVEFEKTAGVAVADTPDIYLMPQEAWVTPFFYQMPYDYDAIIYKAQYGMWQEEFIEMMDLPTGYLYFKKDADLDNINVGEEFVIGRYDDWYDRPRYFKGYVETKGTSDGYPYITTSSNVLYSHSPIKSSPIYYGVGLWYIPALETDLTDWEGDRFNPVQYYGPREAMERHNPALPFAMEYDPLIFTQALVKESITLSDPFRALLDDDGAGYAFAANLIISDVVGFSDATYEDVGSFIDWDNFDDFSGSVLPGSVSYLLRLDATINVWDLLKKECIFHGAIPTWEWDKTLAHHIMRFRGIGPINATKAMLEGRVINANNIIRSSQSYESHCDTWMFNKITAQCNKINNDYAGTFVAEYYSGNCRNRTDTRTIDCASDLTHIKGIGNLTDGEISYITRRYATYLRNLAVPNYTYTIRTTLATMLSLAVGREVVVTDPTGYYPQTHERGLTSAAGLVTRMSVDLKEQQCTVTCRLAPNQIYGWAPACYVTSSVKSGGDTVTCTCTPNYFSPSGSRWDCTYFDCLDYNDATKTYTPRSCSCGNYKVIAFARNKTGSSWEPTLMNFTVTSVDTTDGNSIVLYDGVGTDYANWDTTDEHIIIFDTYDNCVSCQLSYVFFADDNNQIGTNNAPAARWV